MIPYLIIFFLFLFATVNDNRSSRNSWYYFLFFVASLFVGVRDMIGGYDVYVYSEIYEADVSFIVGYEMMEIGFRYFYIFLKIFSDNRHFMLFVMAFIIFYFQFRVYKKYSPLLLFALFLFFCKWFLMSFVYLRQGLAMGIITLAIPYVLSKQYYKFFFVVLLAMLMHKSALLFLPFIFIADRKFSSAQLFYLILITIIIAVTPLSSFMFSFLADAADDSKVAIYVDKAEGINKFYFIEIIILSLILLKSKEQFYETALTRMIGNGLFIYVLVSLLGITNPTFVRFTWYYMPFYIIGLCYFISFQKDYSNLRVFRSVLVVYFALVFFRMLTIWDAGDFMPYKTIFDDTKRNSIWQFKEYRN